MTGHFCRFLTRQPCTIADVFWNLLSRWHGGSANGDSEERIEVQAQHVDPSGLAAKEDAEKEADEDQLVSDRRLSSKATGMHRDGQLLQRKQLEYDSQKWTNWPAVVTPGADSHRTAQAMRNASKQVSTNHKCANYTWEQSASDKKRTGFRPCGVCYLPPAEALAAMPQSPTPENSISELRFVDESHPSEAGYTPAFGGHPTWRDREESFQVRKEMDVHCGFVWGGEPGQGTGYDVSEEDRAAMAACREVVVASAIFGAYDVLQQPKNVSKESKAHVCFFMFVDEPTLEDLLRDGSIPSPEARSVGLWRVVVVKNMPFADPRRNGKVPKLLLHRLFPRARYSLWVDAKLRLMRDPLQILERFLWRSGHTFAISKHYKRFDAFIEAEANKAQGKYDNETINAQVQHYREEGMIPFGPDKAPIESDVPEGCFILREHTPLVNLFSCLWFNEVDRFTSRDQISFGYTRDKMTTPLVMNMFKDCERRDCVEQMYHKELLLKKIQTEKPVAHRLVTQAPKPRPLETLPRQRALVEDELKRMVRGAGKKTDSPLNRKLVSEKKSMGKKAKNREGHQ
eukprot:TRINITY_DN1089_c0_g1_i5.p1 TRINITY_DN1089_c0_g1~~TRINITY_DN1089_c0_g1_i5.p1  ORF type:complete len:580 (+),score=141.45 TRINITY_DN1089_c0_g1_i5:33-1742(+)